MISDRNIQAMIQLTSYNQILDRNIQTMIQFTSYYDFRSQQLDHGFSCKARIERE